MICRCKDSPIRAVWAAVDRRGAVGEGSLRSQAFANGDRRASTLHSVCRERSGRFDVNILAIEAGITGHEIQTGSRLDEYCDYG